LSVAHGGTSIVVFIEEGCCFLGNVEIPENAPDKKYHFTGVIGGHKFSLGRQTCNCWLKFSFICDCAPVESNADTAERSSCFGASFPIRVRISMGNMSIKLGSVLQKDVLFVADNGRYGTLGEFQPGTCAPEVDTILSRGIEVFQSMLQTVEMESMRTGVRL